MSVNTNNQQTVTPKDRPASTGQQPKSPLHKLFTTTGPAGVIKGGTPAGNAEILRKALKTAE